MKYDFDSYLERRGTNSAKWDSYDADVLPMWIADSDFRSPREVIEAVTVAASQGIYGYPGGDAAFRQACAHWQESRFGWKITEKEIAWCPSLGNAIALCLQAFTCPGESAAILTPIYPPFMSLCRLNKRVICPCVLKWRSGRYEIDFAELEAILAKPETKLFLLCNPHNPTGRSFDRKELELIGEFCARHDVIIFSDEIHEDITYRNRHIPMPAVSKKIADICLVGVNASKTFNTADLRCAAAISKNPSLLESFVRERDSLKLGPCSLGLAGAAAAWNKGANYADQLLSYLKANLEHAAERINSGFAGISTYMPDATYLLWLDCRGLDMSPDELGNFFLDKAKTALNNGRDFGPGGEGFMRMNAACPRSMLDEGLNRIERALSLL